VAEISATLMGLFLVGVFFYVETGFRRLAPGTREIFEPDQCREGVLVAPAGPHPASHARRPALVCRSEPSLTR
jgi:hypothetical protein